MTPDRGGGEPPGEQRPVEVVKVPGRESIEAYRSDGREDVALDAAPVLAHGPGGVGGLDIGEPAGEQVAYAATMVGGRLPSLDVGNELARPRSRLGAGNR